MFHVCKTKITATNPLNNMCVIAKNNKANELTENKNK